MNERIKELMEKAGIHENQYTTEKFAELLVGECMDIIANEQQKVEPEWRCKSGHHIWWTIKEHFGVE